MPKRDPAPVGAPCWIDLFTTDPDKSRAFYTELFGWTAEEPNPDFGGYFNFHYNDRPIAGGMRNDGSTEATDSWSVYLAVESAEATVNAAAKQGSDVSVPAMPVPEATQATIAWYDDRSRTLSGTTPPEASQPYRWRR